VDVLNGIAAKLVADAVVPDISLIKWVTPNMVRSQPHLDAGQDILLCPRGFKADINWTSGSGRRGLLLTRRIDLIPRTRLSLDELGQAIDWMTSAQGHFVFEEAIVNSLTLFIPQDVNNNQLTACPLHPWSSDDPQKDQEDMDWGYATVAFEVRYLLNVNQAVI
jgi:hypothetical protein